MGRGHQGVSDVARGTAGRTLQVPTRAGDPEWEAPPGDSLCCHLGGFPSLVSERSAQGRLLVQESDLK